MITYSLQKVWVLELTCRTTRVRARRSGYEATVLEHCVNFMRMRLPIASPRDCFLAHGDHLPVCLDKQLTALANN